MRGAPSPLWGGLGRGRLHARQPKLRFSVQDRATFLSDILSYKTAGKTSTSRRIRWLVRGVMLVLAAGLVWVLWGDIIWAQTPTVLCLNSNHVYQSVIYLELRTPWHRFDPI